MVTASACVFKKVKGKSKWLNFPKALGLNYLPQTIAFNTEMTRTYYELQERDLENTENPNLPVNFNSQMLWNRDFQLRWDLTKNLHMNFESATRAQIEEPYRENTPINKDLYPDFYSVWKDSVKHSIMHLGTPLDYRQTFTASYQLPLNKLPILDWVNSDAGQQNDRKISYFLCLLTFCHFCNTIKGHFVTLLLAYIHQIGSK